MWRLRPFPRPSDCHSVCDLLSATKLCAGFPRNSVGEVFKKTCRSSSNWYSESHASLEDVTEMLLVFPTYSLVSDMIPHRRCPYNLIGCL